MKKAKKQDHGIRGVVKQDEQIGGRIRAIRIDQKISQTELGDQLGVSFQQVQKYEKGVNRVSAVRLNQIATILHTTLEQLTGFNGGPQLDGFEFDLEAYKLAKAFTRLPAHIKPRLRSLINSITETED
jgi:transcriptional regulator with XRE-family HTH domain